MPRASCTFAVAGRAVRGRECRLQETNRGAFLPLPVHSARGVAKLEPGFDWLRRNFVILSMLLAKVPVNGWKSCPITAWAYELDHISGGTGHMAFSRPGYGLPVRPLHTWRGNPGKRPRSRTPRIELHAPHEARKDVIARDDPDQSAARSYQHAPLALNRRSHRIASGECTPRKGSFLSGNPTCCQSFPQPGTTRRARRILPRRPIGRDACSGGRGA